MPFEFKNLKPQGLVLIIPPQFPDGRGFFKETYKQSEFEAHGIPPFVQDNCSRSTKGVLRGLHYQLIPHAQGKLISVTQGKIFDVAVDIRKSSPSYGKWASVTLSSEDHNMIYVPPGFAHGFLVLSDVAEVHYKVTHEYSPQSERGIIWNDPNMGISWPLERPNLSSRDAKWPPLCQVDNNFNNLYAQN